jgi:hypothetical protein
MGARVRAGTTRRLASNGRMSRRRSVGTDRLPTRCGPAGRTAARLACSPEWSLAGPDGSDVDAGRVELGSAADDEVTARGDLGPH